LPGVKFRRVASENLTTEAPKKDKHRRPTVRGFHGTGHDRAAPTLFKLGEFSRDDMVKRFLKSRRTGLPAVLREERSARVTRSICQRDQSSVTVAGSRDSTLTAR
jgi:hypothetical protein